MDANEYELEILKFWSDNEIYKKSKLKNKSGKGFYMMDGPPYATGNIHMGTALNKISKDIAMRMKRMQGFDIFDRPGYDTHGLPIEHQVEKEHNFRSKDDIEKLGVDKFIKMCKDFATKYIDVMNNQFRNLGVWFDFENPYLTLKDSYVETIWDVFKEANKKELLYLGKYPVHVCPRCATAVAFNEIEYSKEKDTSIYVKFELKGQQNTFLVIWTTTPWTLPANTAVMVNPDVFYQKIQMSSGENWIVAKGLVPLLMAELEMGYTVVEEFKGKEMEGWEYINPLSKDLKLETKNAYKVILSARYVTTEEGTGLVHCAPGHGKEDYEVGKEYSMDAPCPVDITGKLTGKAGKYEGGIARKIDEEIIKDLEKDSRLIYKKVYSHDYPHCWRCHSPLLMISLPQWFLKISDFKEKLLESNEKVNWLPSWAKMRMKAWLEGISDWPISRDRFWGTPLPIWVCEDCGKQEVIGSIKELEEKYGKKVKDIHKPGIDSVELKCECGKKMRRVNGVLDVWFDSGVSSWAALDYMAGSENFKKFWPSTLNLEGKDQIRGWWNSQMILSYIKFQKMPFESISMHGMVLDLGKQKMSKSKGNSVSPEELIKKYSRDYLRYYFAKVSKGEDFAFNENEFKEIRKAFIILSNVNSFVNGLNKEVKQEKEVEDKWILSKYNSFVKVVIELYNSYEFFKVIKLFEDFLVNDLSKTYIKLIRERSDNCYDTLNEIRTGLIKLISPVIPFMTEKFWQELKEKRVVKEESIFLSEFPKPDLKKINQKLEEEFSLLQSIIELGLRERENAKIGLRWPLANVKVICDFDVSDDMKNIIKSQLNVKSLEFSKGKEMSVELDFNLTPELEAEGFARELTRKIQAGRKKLGLVKEDKIRLFMSENLKDILGNFVEIIGEKVGADEVVFAEKPKKMELSEDGKIKDVSYSFSFVRV